MDSSQIEFSSSVSVFSGALVGLIPSGLYLLTSITLTVGTIRLNLKRMFVQQFYSIEMLSRVDTLCLDKTGTITNGEMDLIEIVSLNNLSKTRIKNYLRTLLDATDDDNATARAINKAIENEELMPLQSAYSLPFLSKTKYSAVVLSNRESIVLGAREFVLSKKDNANKRALQYEKDGYRVLVLARVGHGLKRGEKIRNAKAMGLLVFLDYIKEDASETIEWFKQNDVNIKIISGDNALTTSQIAKRVGVVNADNYISLEDVDNETLANSVNDYSVFGRVTPEQKEIIIESLIKSKHVVAMTGDGVNDILALKKADCSIAMAGGSQAARNASHLVSLDSNFSKLPEVVKEGRRVINNLQRTASVFLVKTTFSLILSMFFFIWAITWLIKDGTVYSIYPFQPQNLYVWEFCTIAIASFSLSLEPNNERIKSSFLKNILLKALPIAIFMVIPVFIYFFISYFSPDLLSQEGMVVMSVITFVILSFLYLIVICYPYNLYRIILLGGLSVIVCAFFCVDYLLGGSVLGLSYNALNADNYWILLVVLFSSIIAVCAYYFVMYQISTNISKRKNAQDQQGS